MTTTRLFHQKKTLKKRVQTSGKLNPPTDATASQDLLWDDTVTFGDNLPDWRDRIKNGRNATTSMTGFRFGAHVTTGEISASTNDLNRSTRTHSGQIMANNVSTSLPSAAGATVVTEATTNAAIKFVKQYRQKTTNWGGAGEFLGTIVQTARLIRDPVILLRKGVDNLYVDLLRAIKKSGGVGIPAALLKERQRKADRKSVV